MTSAAARRGRVALPWLLLALVGAGAAMLRYGLIENSAIGQLCAAAASPWWCTARQWLVLGFLHDIYGIAALVAAVATLLRPSAWLAWLAAALGAFALELYCFEAGALALLIGCLRLLRWQVSRPRHAPPAQQHRRGKQQVQPQP
ncbi:hypothetical protein [Rhodanobacter caeni]|uniref:DUF4267 domain-containing protein n=1 Tax=Rhodanobacter caeni TaxID=657654 RepID=A0ABP3E192_9GAMM